MLNSVWTAGRAPTRAAGTTHSAAAAVPTTNKLARRFIARAYHPVATGNKADRPRAGVNFRAAGNSLKTLFMRVS